MAHMKLKKVPKKTKFKLVFILIIIYLTFSYTFYNSLKNNQSYYSQEFLTYLLEEGNPHLVKEYKLPRLVNKTITYLLKIDLTHPETLLNTSIISYPETSHDTDEEYDIDSLKEISSYISDPHKVDINNPIIYIYNSHQLENYNSTDLSIYGITPNVLMASYLLKEKLNTSGLSTIVEDTNLTEFLTLNNWDYSSAYKASRIFMLDKKNTYSTIKYYIDIHRDSVNKKLTTVNINNKDYARVLFVVGLEHSNYEANLTLANNLSSLIESKYPGLSRGVYKKEGPGVNGIYNQDISSNVMLIELGGVDNTISEVVNTVNALTDVLSTYISNEKN